MELGVVAERVLKDVTTVFPSMYKGYLERFVGLLEGDGELGGFFC